jgi:hypothetical protein
LVALLETALSFKKIVLQKGMGEFFSSMTIVLKHESFKWEIVNMYGPVQLEREADFQVELSIKNASMTEPFIMGADFNMIRFFWEKSSDNINEPWMDAFNDSQGKIGSTRCLTPFGTWWRHRPALVGLN